MSTTSHFFTSDECAPGCLQLVDSMYLPLTSNVVQVTSETLNVQHVYVLLHLREASQILQVVHLVTGLPYEIAPVCLVSIDDHIGTPTALVEGCTIHA